MDTVLVIAGLDPSGGAGLLADAEVVRAAGLHAAAVASALTVQDSARCHGFEAVDASLVERQLEVLVDDLPIKAVKVGMVGDGRVARAIARALEGLLRRGVPLVFDPVLRASVGGDLLDGEPVEALGELLSLSSLVTPNRGEAQALAGFAVDDLDGQRRAARALRAMGPAAAMVKGGHLDGGAAVDLLDDGGAEPLLLSAPRRAGPAPHGTGCALSTAIACELARGLSLRDAATRAHARVQERIAAARTVGRGRPFLGPPVAAT